jgi:hypothetical protein
MECKLSFQKDSKMRDYLSFFLRKELCYNDVVEKKQGGRL